MMSVVILSAMLRRLAFIYPIILLMLAACQPSPPPAVGGPTVIPFPTMTPGRTVRGILPTPAGLPLSGSNLANPATAVALANRPTVTPNYAACPSLASPRLPDAVPATAREINDEIARFLAEGGAPAALESVLRAGWGLPGSFIRSDLDLTGEGTRDILIGYASPDEGGALVILGCADGRYRLHYQGALGGEAPQVLQTGDQNQDRLTDVLFSSRVCLDEDECSYETQLITWQPLEGRFITLLLDGTIESPEMPVSSDVDGDRVLEVIIRLTSRGTASTGPLRTGVTIFDWNGSHYLRSITQLDPPFFRVQVIHEADRNLQRSEVERAIALYELALNDASLGNWYNDDPQVLTSYALYRLLTAYAFTEDERLLTTYQTITQTYPDPAAAPVYAAMSSAFWNALQVTNNLRSACLEVRDIIAARPEALGLLNRYGSSSPTYAANDLCPF